MIGGTEKGRMPGPGGDEIARQPARAWRGNRNLSVNSGGAAMRSRVSESAVDDSPVSGCAGTAGQ